MKQVFKILDLVFIFTAIYTILQQLFDISPYKIVYMMSRLIDSEMQAVRAKGLLGNPLILCGVTLFYQITLYIRYYYYKEMNIFMLLLSCVVLLLSGTRTRIIAGTVLYIVYFIQSKSYKSIKILLYNISALIGISFFLIYFLGDYIYSVYERFLYASVEQRSEAFPSVMNMFAHNILGVGEGNVYTEVKKYATGFLELDFTFDNFFLSQIAAYGILCVISITFYFIYIKLAYQCKHKDINIFKSTCLIFITWSMIGFSFNLEAFVQCTYMVYGIIGFLFANVQRQPIKMNY